MARKILQETGYVFTPSTNTIVIPRYIPREKLVLITNVTTNQVIYNFSDQSLRSTSYNAIVSGATGTTTIVLNFNTSGMSSTDKLQITIDEFSESFKPDETYLDPVNKLRVSTPQALIDTDFEYGTQVTKWENILLMNNRPFAYPSTIPLTASAISLGANSRIVTVATTNPPAVGTPIFILDSALPIANGNFVVESVSAGVSFTYTAKAVNTTTLTNLLEPTRTIIYPGTLYTGAAIGAAPTISVSGSDLRVTVTTTVPHGLSIGNEIAVAGITGTNPPNGNYVVAGVNSPTQFVYYAHPSTGTPASLTATSSRVYCRPQGQILHRPFDGGVLFSANSSSNNTSTARQTRRYFRYQSGKGLQVSSGTILKPYSGIESLVSSGTTVTVQTREPHNIAPGTTIIVSGANETAYNGTFTVETTVSPTKFTYTAASTPASSMASGIVSVSVLTWSGASNRLGQYDSQNGLFWDFDGTTLWAVRRSSNLQISGRSTVTTNSNTVTQTNAEYPTAYSKQLIPGDSVVIRGQTYLILSIESDTSMTIYPEYRGTNTSLATITKVTETKIPQSQFNIDRLDGTGPSGYNIDLSKMQMFYIDYSWYGAGFIRWGVRGPNGDVIYCHKLANNNLNTEAYMRSGNLPARYETINLPPYTITASAISTTDSILYTIGNTGFPTSGTLLIRDGAKTEYVNYTGRTASAFTGLTRGQVGTAVAGISTTWTANSASGVVSSATGLQVGQRVFSTTNPSPIQEGAYITSISGTTVTLSEAPTAGSPNMIFAPMGTASAMAFNYSGTNPVLVQFAYPNFAPSISHWGTSVMMDGRFDDDKSLIFTYGQERFSVLNASASKALFSIRIAPSVDNGIAGAFGAREIINRMQLKLTALDISTSTSNANMLIRAFLNTTPTSSVVWTNAVNNSASIQNSSLAQIADFGTGPVTVNGGEITGGFFVNTVGSVDLSNLRDLGNSILGGGTASAGSGIYPDGPDTLTIVVTNLNPSASVNVLGRLSWTEAQA